MDFNQLLQVAVSTAAEDKKKAMIMLESLIGKLEETGDRFSEYHSFSEPFDYMLYDYLNESAQKSKNIAENFALLYKTYGDLLLDSGLFEEAASAFSKSMRWNPIDSDAAFSYAEACRQGGDYDRFRDITIEALNKAYRPLCLARGYRNLGESFYHAEQYKEAAGCYILSLDYDPDSMEAQSALDAIRREAGPDFREPEVEEMLTISGDNGFLIGANPDIVNLAMAYAKQAEEGGSPETARYLLRIVYDLMEDEHIKTMIDNLEK